MIYCLISISALAQSGIEIEYLRDEENLVYAISIPNKSIEQVKVSNATSTNNYILGELALDGKCLIFNPDSAI